MAGWVYQNSLWILYAFIILLPTVIYVIPFGVYPLLVERRLRRKGVTVPATCTGASWDEGRVLEFFSFTTVAGNRSSYRSPLADGRISHDGEEVRIIYDPKAPHGRAHTEMELFGGRSQAPRDLWRGIMLLAVVNVMILPFAVLYLI
ncbi:MULTISPECIES: DUF3592 domain-containing protein [unclassified Streptomyces]|uniref:DUF3592 domain-containing protein n=1 Tax=unclassified Streptomyces TaxID=2593676 RepID=UPI00340630DF